MYHLAIMEIFSKRMVLPEKKNGTRSRFIHIIEMGRKRSRSERRNFYGQKGN
ncbi:hypothetical protein CLOLEP_00560 [[Clostridium] leptum DSM 753]|uniref:Uncharacterized protein n=1 Tax=[Clostridium] leptum DSM 753 TaxID=428125 RepID=A7VPT3_9FIRM|nr:hypothetical protein CLOLEP_00560 [[Clostridium] leptum DSM 753]